MMSILKTQKAVLEIFSDVGIRTVRSVSQISPTRRVPQIVFTRMT